MANHLLRTLQVLKRAPSVNVAAVRLGHGHSSAPSGVIDYELIGNREVVGPGVNNQPTYEDTADFPLPAIRFKPNDAPGVQALREKEKGDWHKLTKEEKKALYRASFYQTLAEVEAPTGFWKSVVGCTFGAVGVALWIAMGIMEFVLDPLPDSLSLEHRQEVIQFLLDIEHEPIEGISSKFDYEKNDWKN